MNTRGGVKSLPYIAVAQELRESGAFSSYSGLEQDITVLDFSRAEHANQLRKWGLSSGQALVAIGKLNAKGEVIGIVWSQKVGTPAEARTALYEKLTGRQASSTTSSPPVSYTGDEGIPSSWDRDGYVNSKDGSVLVTVPAGEFFYGAAPNDNKADDDEKPGRRLQLPSFQISKYEVTNAQYARFVQATSHRSAGNDEWKECASKLGARAPVVCVNWNDAQAYCEWAGLRLPGEQEWERAARGTDGRIYPWGDDWDATRAVRGAERPSKVGSLSLGRSPAGCYDMAGNVWEWTSDKYENKDRYALRGGSWSSKYPASLRASSRSGYSPVGSGNGLGFRCARTP